MEPRAARLTSPGGGAHDVGDPAGTSSDEEVRAMAGMPVDSVGAGAETTGNAPGSAVRDPPATMEHAMPVVSQVMEMGLRRPIRAQQRSRRSPPMMAAVEVEEIP